MLEKKIREIIANGFFFNGTSKEFLQIRNPNV